MLATHTPDTPGAARQDDVECAAFNAAFDELGFDWRWDPGFYRTLRAVGDERARLAIYLREYQAHLLKAYDLAFLCDAILDVRRRYCTETMSASA